MCLKIFFQGSPPGNKPLIINFPKKALHCNRGSINPRPPSSFAVVMIFWDTLALTKPSLDPQRKILISFCTCDKAERDQQPSFSLCFLFYLPIISLSYYAYIGSNSNIPLHLVHNAYILTSPCILFSTYKLWFQLKFLISNKTIIYKLDGN